MVGLMNVAVVILMGFTVVSTVIQVGLLVYLFKSKNDKKTE